MDPLERLNLPETIDKLLVDRGVILIYNQNLFQARRSCQILDRETLDLPEALEFDSLQPRLLSSVNQVFIDALVGVRRMDRVLNRQTDRLSRLVRDHFPISRQPRP